jgi:hypothetical protein
LASSLAYCFESQWIYTVNPGAFTLGGPLLFSVSTRKTCLLATLYA